MTNQDILSVLLPAYQSSEFILGTLESIKKQTLKNFRVYISIDKSEDKTFELCREFLKDDSRFEIINQKDRLGWVANSNFLLNLISTKYAVFAFHDDLLHPQYFEKLIDKLEENPQAVVAFSDTLLTDVNDQTEHWVYAELDGIQDPLQRAISIINQKGSWWVPNRGIFRASQIKKIGGLKLHDSGEFSADLPWLFHMSLYGEFVRIAETLCYKYYKTDSLSRSWTFNKKSKYDVIVSCMRELWIADIPTQLKVTMSKPIIDFLARTQVK